MRHLSVLLIVLITVAASADAESFIVPYDGTVYLTPVGGEAGAVSEFGLGTSTDTHVAVFTGLPRNPNPNHEVEIGDFSASEVIDFSMLTLWNAREYWAFSSDAVTDASMVAFSDVNNSLGMGGNIIEQTGESTWLLHLDDAASYLADDDDNDLMIRIRMVAGPTPVHMDIKPGSCPNPLNLKSRGKLPVALLGTEEFDVSLIDIASLTLSRADGVGGSVSPIDGPPGPEITIEDVGTPFEGDPCECHETEGDGIHDLAFKFSRPEVVAALELRESEPGATVELVVSGTLIDGTEFSGSDCILIVPQSDFDEDNDVDQSDFGHLQVCYRGPMKTVSLDCADADIDEDGDVDISDFGGFQRCISGADKAVDPRCAD